MAGYEADLPWNTNSRRKRSRLRTGGSKNHQTGPARLLEDLRWENTAMVDSETSALRVLARRKSEASHSRLSIRFCNRRIVWSEVVTPITETRTNWRCFGAPGCTCPISWTVSTGSSPSTPRRLASVHPTRSSFISSLSPGKPWHHHRSRARTQRSFSRNAASGQIGSLWIATRGLQLRTAEAMKVTNSRIRGGAGRRG
jgi:hypothetical protein